jgi:hypothetical protein
MSLMIPMARRAGGPLAHTTCCFKNFQAMEYNISTGYGVSDLSYTSTPDHRLQGSGQGGSQSPILCTSSSDVILDFFYEADHPIEFEHCSGDLTQRAFRTIDQYVDDQSNGAVNAGDDAAECVRKLKKNANLSNDLLNASVGGENFLKSFCYIIEQVPTEDGNGWRILTNDENPDYRIKVRDWDHNGVLVDLLHKDATELHHTLWHHLNIADNNTEATNMHIAKAKKFNKAVMRSKLSPRQKRMAYGTFVIPSITFPLRASGLSMSELQFIQRPLIPMIFHGRRVHQHIKQMYLYNPSTFGGYKIPDLEVSTNEHRWALLRDHLERDDATKQLLMASLSYSQLAVGSGTQLLPLPYRGYAHLVQDVYVKQLWQFSDSCNAQVHIPGLWIPGLQRKKDRYLIDVAREAGLSDRDQVILRETSTVLKIHTGNDITTLDGKEVKPGIVDGTLEDRTSRYRFPIPLP